jgi:hypothetical protein
MWLSLRKAAHIAVGDCRVQEIGPHQKKSGLSPTHFSVFLRSAKGEARGQIRLLLKNTPISDQIQRFGVAVLLVIGLTITPFYDSDTGTGSSYL